MVMGVVPMKLEKAMMKKLPPAGGGAGGMLGDLAGDVASMGASMAADLAGASGMIPVVWGPEEFHFRFNPTNLRTGKQAEFATRGATGTPQGNRYQFTGSKTASLDFTFLLDEWEAPPGMGQDVREMVQKLERATNPEDPRSNKPMPWRMLFVWGSFRFTGYIKSINATYTLFRRNGTPARAEVVVSMIEHLEEPGAQNPTSGGPSGRRSRQLIDGDSLQSISYVEYGDPNLWRAIADVNGIDDPLSVAPGAYVVLPSKSDAQAFR
jgi:hypothetical protein